MQFARAMVDRRIRGCHDQLGLELWRQLDGDMEREYPYRCLTRDPRSMSVSDSLIFATAAGILNSRRIDRPWTRDAGNAADDSWLRFFIVVRSMHFCLRKFY